MKHNNILPDISICRCCEEKLTYCTDTKEALNTSCAECGTNFTTAGLINEKSSVHKNNLIYTTESEEFRNETALEKAVEDLKNGCIVSVKGIGGYHLACSPYCSNAVKEVRIIKKRDAKPLAVMFKDLHEVQKICEITPLERVLLQSPEAPIVLMDLSNDPFAEETLMGSNRCGGFLPYSPLHKLLLNRLEALIMTSANLSGSSIVYKDDRMLAFFKKIKEAGSPYFSGVLHHDKDIIRSIEDSVVQTVNNQIQMIRRGRGYVPSSFKIENSKDLIALGGDLKAVFCLTHNNHAILSQFFGDLEEESVFNDYKNAIKDLSSLLNIKPEFGVCDSHPSYISTLYAKKLDIPITTVQHHHAHIASVAAEHGIYEDITGVAFDGTGYGNDGAIWGGEFLICGINGFKRLGHLEYMKLTGGDGTAVDAVKTASSMLIQTMPASKNIRKFDERSDIINAAIKHNINTFESSSMGRLFDAVSAILGICKINSYEGECAIKLQQTAEAAIKKKVPSYPLSFDIYESNGVFAISFKKLLMEIFDNVFLRQTVSPEAAALGFHEGCAGMVLNMCEKIRKKSKLNKVALSGGVFQNRLLMSLCLKKLEEASFRCYINNHTSPNDSSIALGQAYAGGLRCV